MLKWGSITEEEEEKDGIQEDETTNRGLPCVDTHANPSQTHFKDPVVHVISVEH